MGKQRLRSAGSPCSIGKIIAIFHGEGKVFRLKEGKRWNNIGANSGAHNFRTMGGIPSGPEGLGRFRVETNWGIFQVVKTEGKAWLGAWRRSRSRTVKQWSLRQAGRQKFQLYQSGHIPGPKELRMGWKPDGQKLRGIAFARDQNEWSPVADEVGRSASWRAKRPLAFCMVTVHLFLALTKPFPDVRLGERSQRQHAAFQADDTVASLVKPLRSWFAGFEEV